MEAHKMNLAPIALFVYNRLDTLVRTVEALKMNSLAEESELFVFSDGSKVENDHKVLEVRKYVKKIGGFKKVTVFEAEKNKGLANSIIDGVTRIVNEYGKVIVLEDDLITSPFFLKYMNDALVMYEDEWKVGSISGHLDDVRFKLPQTFFLKGSDCWGWATWKRSWEFFNPNGQELLDEIKARKLEYEFNLEDSLKLMEMLKDQIKGKNDSWHIRNYASLFLKDKLVLIPSKSFVKNIGLEGTHYKGKTSEIPAAPFPDKPFDLIKIKPEEDRVSKEKMINFWRSMNKTFLERIFIKLFKCCATKPYAVDHEEQLNDPSASLVIDIFKKYYTPKSVIDVGCGAEMWLKEWYDDGVEIKGLDLYSKKNHKLVIPDDKFETIDLNMYDAQKEKKYDLCMSLEVAEHLEPENSEAFVKTLTSLSDMILFSAAIPYQPGTAHINCRSIQFWVDLFKKQGFDCFDIIRPFAMRDERIEWWYSQNILIFAKDNKKELLIKEGGARSDNKPMFFYHQKHVDMLLAPFVNRKNIFMRAWNLCLRIVLKRLK